MLEAARISSRTLVVRVSLSTVSKFSVFARFLSLSRLLPLEETCLHGGQRNLCPLFSPVHNPKPCLSIENNWQVPCSVLYLADTMPQEVEVSIPPSTGTFSWLSSNTGSVRPGASIRFGPLAGRGLVHKKKQTDNSTVSSIKKGPTFARWCKKEKKSLHIHIRQFLQPTTNKELFSTNFACEWGSYLCLENCPWIPGFLVAVAARVPKPGCPCKIKLSMLC